MTVQPAAGTCECGSGEQFEACCGRYLAAGQWPTTATGLMRARYTAYVRADIPFLSESNHPDTRHEFDPLGARRWAEGSEWKGLEILDTEGGGEDDTTGSVEFVAHYRRRGEMVRHHELALFEKHDGRWHFKDARSPQVETVVRAAPKVGRNEPCPCGSGRKYKKCCGA
ncbi:MAG: YchJ family protein [Ectothiorhodospiraceae bacterium]|nr:YchJ family protein [Ectothiorhodospiraceae bacterium]